MDESQESNSRAQAHGRVALVAATGIALALSARGEPLFALDAGTRSHVVTYEYEDDIVAIHRDTPDGWTPPAQMRASAPLPPDERIGIRTAIRQQFAKIEDCARRGASATTAVSGRVTIRLVLREAGLPVTVTLASTTLPDEAIGQCIAEAARRWTFPAMPSGQTAIVNYPFFLDEAP